MLIISSREFRENQKSYLDKVDEGIEILIQRGKSKAYKIFAVKEDDSLMSKEEFFAKIDRGMQDYREGRTTRVSSIEELRSLLTSL